MITGVSARRRARRIGDRGQALVEVAIALPILLALLVGIFEFASAYRVQQVITNAAREGARIAVLPTATDSLVTDRVDSYLNSGGIFSGTHTTNPVDVSTATTGDTVTVAVSVDYTFNFIGPVLRLFTIGCQSCDPGTITLNSISTMRKE
jgi:Flp pilus assembly protein TadG